ncbi:MAG: UDP-N-acetylmuramoyl-L-alanine--D-glutamate ligase [Nitrospirota bacterium]
MGIKDKKVTVVGLARSGVGAANLLSELGADVTVTDKKTEYELKDFVKKLNPSIKRALGGHPEDIFTSADMIVVSPGVQLDTPPITNAKAKDILIIGELELAYQIISSKFKIQSSKFPKFLAVTGTNGKSTTTTLLDLMLKKCGFETLLGGNIGNALTSSLLTSHFSPDYIVAEVSSFQLESIKDFRPKGAAILNITPDHLDRYYSLEEYRDAKAKIFENQQEDDFLVINADDPETMKVQSSKFKVQSEKPKVFYFSRKKEVKGIYFKDGRIYCNFPDSSLLTPHFPLIKADEIKIKGVHNLENAMAASAMALLADCPLKAVIDSLREFPGLEHRLEFVREINGIRYINDSKGTNVGAVIKSLESFTKPIVLIAGGRDKAGDFSLLGHLVRERVKAIILIGEASEKIKKALGDLTETVMAKDLRDAVIISHNKAVNGDVVLLSPACASFDMFMDFEDRGRQFKDIVWSLK